MYQTICTWTHERHSLSIVIWILYIQNSQIKCMIFKKSIMSNQCVKCKFLSSNHSPISPKKLNSLHITEWSLSGNILGGVYVGFTSTANQKIIPFTSKPSQKTCPVYSWACAVQGDSISVLEVNYEAVFCTEGGGQGKGWRAVWTTCCCHIVVVSNDDSKILQILLFCMFRSGSSDLLLWSIYPHIPSTFWLLTI